MPSFFTSTSVSSNFAEQTSINPEPFQGATPPLLPAFLITGLLLAAIVFIIVWRHLIERRNAQQEDDPTWPLENTSGGHSSSKGPPPKLWDLKVMSESARATWESIMPLSAAALRAKPKPRRPRYLVPSDRPVSFFGRMFGGERRQPLRSQPLFSVFAPTQPRPVVLPSEHEEEEPIDRLQVTVLISLPHPRRQRHTSYIPPARRREGPSLPPEAESVHEGSDLVQDGEDSDGASSPQKGKKRSFEKLPSSGYDPQAYYDYYDDDEGPLEVAFGTVSLPFVEEG